MKFINPHNISKHRIGGTTREVAREMKRLAGSRVLRCGQKVSGQLQEDKAGGREFHILGDATLPNAPLSMARSHCHVSVNLQGLQLGYTHAHTYQIATVIWHIIY